MDVRPLRGPVYRVIDGFTLNRYFSVELFRSALRYEPRKDDIFLVTFPKSGTIWLQQIVYLIIHDGLPAPSELEFHRNSPFLEVLGAESVEKMVRPGLIKTHLEYNMIPKSTTAKYVWVCRNPKDICVSFFYHTKNLTGYEFSDGKLEDFYELFLQGANDYGDYFDHVLSWYAHRNDPNVLFLHYEGLKADPRSQVLKLAAFLGSEYHQRLVQEPGLLDRVLEFSALDYMKNEANKANSQNKAFTQKSLSSEDGLCPGLKHYVQILQQYPRTTSAIRKGVLGDWRNHFTEDMNTRMEKKIYDKLSGTEFIEIWKSHGIL